MSVTLQRDSPKGHICIFGYKAWGHLRPECTLAARIVKSRPIYVSFFVPLPFFNKTTEELARNFGSGEDHLRAFIRVVGVLDEEEKHTTDTSVLDAAYAKAYSQLAKSHSVTCAQTFIEFESILEPNAVVLDFFAKPLYDSIVSISGAAVGMHVFYTAAANALLPNFGPKHMGGKGDLRAQVDAAVARTGRSIEDVGLEVILGTSGTIVNVPGLPPMYDHEYQPQTFPLPPSVVPMWLHTQALLDVADSLLLCTPEVYEPEQVAAVRTWFAETGRKVYVVGPSLPLNGAVVAREDQLTDRGREIEHFMDAILQSHGAQSLVYISFGTHFWSTEPEKIWAFVDVVMERNIPFIMSHASPLAVVPEIVAQKVKQYGKGILSLWSPQQNILSHPVTGWFVTHGGHNSTIESLSLGVPMIFWPYQADQPTNAIHTSEILDAAYELIEVRTGLGLKPRHRTGTAPIGTIDAVKREAHDVLEKAFGEDGARKRKNVQKLQKEIASAWTERGPSRRDLEAFLDSVVA